LAISEPTSITEESLKQRREALCDAGLPDVEMCGLDSIELEEPPASIGVMDEAINR
jgi:hypothetical protein